MSGTRLPMHGRNHRPKGWYGEDDPGGSDPLNWLGQTGAQDRYEDVILALGPLAFWKLDEQSGTTAADSSGNGYHLTGSPDWGQAALPPGGTSARFDTASTSLERSPGSFPGLTGDLSVIAWVRRTTLEHGPIIFQGDGGWGRYGTRGWGLGWENAVTVSQRPCVMTGNSATPETLEAPSQLPVGTPALLGCTRSGNTWRLYWDGAKVAQGTLQGFTLMSTEVSLGHDLWPSPFVAYADLSYVVVWDRALTDAQMLTLYDTVPGGGRWVVAPYTINPNIDSLVFAEGTGAVTLPTASGRAGYTVTVKRVGAGTITVTAHGTEQIDGSGSPGTVSLSTSHAAVTVASDAVGWRILHKYL
jgi:hypothetical protein